VRRHSTTSSLVTWFLVTNVAASCADSGHDAARQPGSYSGEVLEELRVDGYANDLVPIRDIAVASDGTIAVLQSQDAVVRFFDAHGSSVGTVGGQGQGPGEFMTMANVGWLADTLWVFDPEQRRFTLIAPAWDFVRHIGNVPANADLLSNDTPEGFTFPFVIPEALGQAGAFLALMMVSAGPDVPPVFVDRTAIGLISAGGVVERVTLLPRPLNANVVTPEGGSATLPFGNSPVHDIALSVDRLVIAMASLEGTDAGTFSIAATTLDGDTVYQRRYPFEGERIPKAIGDSIVEARVALTSRISPRLAEAVREASRVPAFYPPLQNIVVGRDRTVWVGLREQGEGSRYAVVGPEGDLLGRVVLPVGSRVAVAERTRAWVIERDSLGVESVVRYSVDWTPN